MTGLGGYTMLPHMAAANFQPIFADASGLTHNKILPGIANAVFIIY
jgi:hypothetical protein